ncbi:MAG: rRNA methyltransferase [Geodermatophilaceae bacterium]|nr:rRNA methyltransferase [Geodermatophilaceae bacterium]
MADLPGPLRTALDAELDGYSMRDLGKAAERLSIRYRADHAAAQPILSSPLDAAAYLTTRMSATYAAARQVFGRLAEAHPDFRPRTMLDLGAGTGACTWAAADAFPSLESSHLVDRSGSALAAALRMLQNSDLRVTHAADRLPRTGAGTATERTDLAVCGFLLGELDPADQAAVICEMCRTASVVAVIEPGTTAGYRRILQARSNLIEAGRHVLAPCPHEVACPLEPTQDWCHFAVRLTRSIRHRQVKGGERGYEDEKYAYVVTATEAPAGRTGRILRHPQIRTGHVRMTFCDTDPGIEDMTVSKRHGADYRAARHAHWGDSWPPSSSP